MDARTDYAHILYEVPEEHIARIVLNRPHTANAQDTQFLYELNDAFEQAAHDALRLGMVNQVVPRDELEREALVMARKIAVKSRFALKLAKKAINGAQNAQGRELAMQNAFHLHQLAHTHWLKLYDSLMDPTGLPEATRKALGIDIDAA